MQSPASDKPETPRKANPRPNAGKGVPKNPIQALKHRRAQQDKEAEERRVQQLLEAEQRRATRAQGGSVPSSPQSAQALALAGGLISGDAGEELIPSSANTEPLDSARMLSERQTSTPTTPHCITSAVIRPQSDDAEQMSSPPPISCPPPRSRAELLAEDVSEGPSAAAIGAALTPLERRAQRQNMASPRGGSKPPLPVSSAVSGEGRGSGAITAVRRDGDPQSQSAPSTLEKFRPSDPTLEGGARTPRASSSQSPRSPAAPAGGEPSATARLRERMRQREGGSTARTRSPVGGSAGAAASGWQCRIEARQREAEFMQEQEAHHKQQTDERSSRRNDALRKVMERQAQRQQEVEGLEA